LSAFLLFLGALLGILAKALKVKEIGDAIF